MEVKIILVKGNPEYWKDLKEGRHIYIGDTYMEIKKVVLEEESNSITLYI